ncbi:MAG: ABC transporter substrate-binding protein [Rhodospirillales bacterium]|nr:ABC transporter substrate-binding protein [Rhodospirillales bacterium]MDE2200324.1 ABC transporter substrate-binding protein [Rhodospirillales bacterium]
MLQRRHLLRAASIFAAAPVFLSVWGGFAAPARADAAADDARFIEALGKDLVAVVNGPGSTAEKQAALLKLVDAAVDVEGIARFCLGRFWRVATPSQQENYVSLFHRVMQNNITGRLGQYKGVSFTMGRTTPRDGDVGVATVVTQPGQAPADVEWIVATIGGKPQIVDVMAEGTSMRLTQRSDYTSFLSHNNDNVQALIDAMRKQALAAN